jgi:hypothetical protein
VRYSPPLSDLIVLALEPIESNFMVLLLFLIMDSLYTRPCPSQAFFYLFLFFLLSRILKTGGRAGGLDFGSQLFPLWF